MARSTTRQPKTPAAGPSKTELGIRPSMRKPKSKKPPKHIPPQIKGKAPKRPAGDAKARARTKAGVQMRSGLKKGKK